MQKTTTYLGFEIKPKLDMPKRYLGNNGKVITEGYVVVKDHCNVMPGATWFYTVPEARHGIRVYLKTKGNAQDFWEIMQPFKYKTGQDVSKEHGKTGECFVVKGRFYALVVAGKVIVAGKAKTEREVPDYTALKAEYKINTDPVWYQTAH